MQSYVDCLTRAMLNVPLSLAVQHNPSIDIAWDDSANKSLVQTRANSAL